MSLSFQGKLAGHGDWVTAIKVHTDVEGNKFAVTGSRDKTVIVHDLERVDDINNVGTPIKRLTGHSHFVSDLDLTQDGSHAISASWDGTLRLWNLKDFTCTQRFVGHTKDVLTCAFGHNDKVIISGGRDNTIRLWDTAGKNRLTIDDHADWVSSVRVIPDAAELKLVSGSWDRVVKFWALGEKLNATTPQRNFAGLTGYINVVAPAPDGTSVCGAGKDGKVFIWDLTQLEGEEAHVLYTFETDQIVNDIVYDPQFSAVYVIGDKNIQVWELDARAASATLRAKVPCLNEREASVRALCGALVDGQLFVGCADGNVHVFASTQ